MNKEHIRIGYDTFTINVYQSTIGGAGRHMERWELNITNQYQSQLLHTSIDGCLAEFLDQKTGIPTEVLLMEYAKREVEYLAKKSRRV